MSEDNWKQVSQHETYTLKQCLESMRGMQYPHVLPDWLMQEVRVCPFNDLQDLKKKHAQYFEPVPVSEAAPAWRNFLHA